MKISAYMKKNDFLLILIIFTAVFTSGCGRPKIEWQDFIKFDDITYIAVDYIIDDRLNNIELGEVYGTVKHKVADVEFDIHYKSKNGDAARYKKGTKVYSVVGYKTSFRLAVETGKGVMLYEARNTADSIGSDMLDIENKVEYIIFFFDSNYKFIKSRIDDQEDIERIIDIFMNSPVDYTIQTAGGDIYYIEFYLKDGTSTKMTYNASEGILTDNIRLSGEMKDTINSYIEK